MMKHSSCKFDNLLFSGFGRQSEKFSCIGTCIRCNFMPWIVILESVQTVFSPLLVPNLYSDTLKPMNITELLENFVVLEIKE